MGRLCNRNSTDLISELQNYLNLSGMEKGMEALLESIEKEDDCFVSLRFSTSWVEKDTMVEEKLEAVHFPLSLLAVVLGLDKTATDYYQGKQADNTMFMHTNAFIENTASHKGTLKLLFASEPVKEGLGCQVEWLSRQEDIETEFVVTAVTAVKDIACCQDFNIKMSKNCFKKLCPIAFYKNVDVMFNRMRNEELSLLTANEIIEKLPKYLAIVKA